MADTSIGTARVDVVVNTDQFDAAIKSAKRSVSDMSQAAQDQYNKLSAAEKRRVDSLINQANKIGLTREAQVAYNAALKTNGPLLDDLTRKIAKNSAAASAAATGLGNSGKSVKELQFAMRGLPAQLTDIFTSLASGQRPTMVLLQQGGQLKDMFGGIGPAAKALSSSLLGLINPLTVTAAAAGALFLAWEKGSDEATEFNKALILTGNQANTTSAELAALAEEMDNLGGVTQHSAAAALAQVVASGEFTEAQFKQVATAAELMRSAAGKSIQETIQEFAKIKGDPVKALLEFNEKQRFLTQAQLDNIRTLKEQGRQVEAVAEAFRVYYDVQVNRAGQLVENLGTLEQAWRGVKLGISETIDKLLDFGREGTRASVALERSLRAMPFGVGSTFGLALDKGREGAKPDFSNVNSGPIVNSEQERAATKAQEDLAKAQQKFFEDGLRYGSEREQLEQRILQMIAEGREAGIDAEKLKLRAVQMRAEAEAKASRGGGGKRSEKALPDFAKDSQKELAKLLETEARAREQFDAMAATLDGPLAAAQYRYQQDQAKLNDLARTGAIDADSLARAQENLTRQYQEDAAAIEARLDPGRQLLEDLQFEIELMKMGNAERAAAIQMRGLDAESVRKYGDAVLEANRQIEDSQRAIDAMDNFRDAAESFLVDLPSKGKDAWRDFLDDLTAQLNRWASRGLIEQIFGAYGTNGQGTSGGGWLSGILGAFAGSSGGSANYGEAAGSLLDLFTSDGFGFASGGYTGDGPRNQPAGVVHKGEYVLNAMTTRALGRSNLDRINSGQATSPGGTGAREVVSVTNNMTIQGRVDNRTANQIAIETGRRVSDATRRF